MAKPVTPAQIYPALKALLGLPENISKFELRVSCNDLVTVACEYYPCLDAVGIGQLASVLGEYELVNRAVPADDAPCLSIYSEDSAEYQAALAKVVGFDSWMRQRTERAHAEFMGRTGAL